MIQASSLSQLSPQTFNASLVASPTLQSQQPNLLVQATTTATSPHNLLRATSDHSTTLFSATNQPAQTSSEGPAATASPLPEVTFSQQQQPTQYYPVVQIESETGQHHPPVYQIQDNGQIDPFTEGILDQVRLSFHSGCLLY